MEIIFREVPFNDNLTTFAIKNNELTGITGIELDKINPSAPKTGTILVNKVKITSENIFEYLNKIVVIKVKEPKPYLRSVREYMENYIKEHNLTMKNASKKQADSLKIVGLDDTYLTKDYLDLSYSEKYLLALAMGLLSNPLIIILKDPFYGLDLKNEKQIMTLLIRLKEKYNKYIIINTTDSNKLYKYTNHLLVFKNRLLLDGPTKEIYQRVDYLHKNRIPIPEIVSFTYLAKKTKKVKIDYHRDIRDLIKDVYKHV